MKTRLKNDFFYVRVCAYLMCSVFLSASFATAYDFPPESACLSILVNDNVCKFLYGKNLKKFALARDAFLSYAQPICGSTQYFSYDSDEFVLPASAREKYDSDGKVKFFPGQTIVNWFEKGSQHYVQVSSLADDLQGDIIQAGFGDVCAFLPYDTLHMTLYDIVTRPQEGQSEAVTQAVAAVFTELKGLLRSVQMEIKGVSICAGTSIVAWVYPNTAADLMVIHLLRAQLRERLYPIIGDILAPAENFLGHVTLAYMTQNIPGERYRQFKMILQKYADCFVCDFSVCDAELRHFGDMEKWAAPLNVLPLVIDQDRGGILRSLSLKRDIAQYGGITFVAA